MLSILHFFIMCIVLFKLLILIHLLDFISTQDYHVLNFGAVGDGITNDTKAVRDALMAAYKTNGGRVIFDAGYKFLTGPLNVSCNVKSACEKFIAFIKNY